LPTATWYEKNDLNTSDMHPFIHPLSTAVDPAWQSRSDWEIYKGFAKKFSEVCVGHLGVEREVVLSPLMHDSRPNWRSPSACRTGSAASRPDPRQDGAEHRRGRTRLPELYKRFTALGPLMNKVGNGGKGIAWNTQTEVEQLGELNITGQGTRPGSPAACRSIDTDIDACEVVLQLAPETNGHVAVKAWEALSEADRRDHTHLALFARTMKIRFRDIQAQPRKIISSADVERHRSRNRVATTPATPTCTS
jgi:nitrate reductase alpha subunit